MVARKTADADRELTRDEVHVPELHRLPAEWERDNALLQYRILRRSGWIGRIAVGLVIVGIISAVASNFLPVPDWLIGACLIGSGIAFFAAGAVVFIRRRRYR